MKNFPDFILMILLIAPIGIDNHRSNKITAPSNIIFIDSVSHFNTINDVLILQEFKNKTVYIDLWATTCIPCIKEFAFAQELHDVYKGKSVEFLYICYNFHGNVDSDENRKKWKELVNKHQLQGIHIYTYILPPDSLIHESVGLDFFEKHPIDPAYGIPNYFIAKNGKILDYNAARPSDLPLLKSQLDSFVNMK